MQCDALRRSCPQRAYHLSHSSHARARRSHSRRRSLNTPSTPESESPRHSADQSHSPTILTPPSATSCAPSRPSRKPTTSASASSSGAPPPTSSPPRRSTASTAPRRDKRVVDDLALKAARPHLGGPTSQPRTAAALQHKAAFDAYVRSGDATGLRDLEAKALSVGSDPDGGYLVAGRAGEPRSTAACATSRRSAPSPRCARSPAPSTRSRSPSPAPPPAGSPRPPRARRPTRRRSPSSPSRRWSSTPCRPRPGPARRRRRQHRRVDRRRGEAAFAEQEGTAFVTGDGTAQAEGLPRLHQGRQRHLELGQDRLRRDRRRPAPSPRPTPATS